MGRIEWSWSAGEHGQRRLLTGPTTGRTGVGAEGDAEVGRELRELDGGGKVDDCV